jgi:hypothetical protein
MMAGSSPPTAPLTLPAEGALRVHPEPAALPRLRREGPGRNRFDDPEGIFLVRYAANTLHGCLVETMARFRPDPATEELLSAVTGIEPDDIQEPAFADPRVGVADWLSKQHIGQVRITSSDPLLVDVEHAAILDALDAHPAVRAALEESELGTRQDPARLDAGIIRLGGQVGRPISQAVSRAIYETVGGVDGIGYWSRLDSTQRCWAIYDHAPVRVAVSTLDAQVPEHRKTVQTVASRFGIRLPADWR